MSRKLCSFKSITLQLFWMWHDYWSDFWIAVAKEARQSDSHFLAYVAVSKAQMHVDLQLGAAEAISEL